MFVEIDNAPIYVNIEGQGEPALFLHGVPDSADMWKSVVAQVSSNFHCFVPDLPGFYRSGIPESFEFNLQYYGQFVNRFVEEMHIETPLTLVAHDWGGIFAMSFACQFPHKVKRIVGGSFPFSHLYRWHPWARIWQTPGLGELSMLALNKALFDWELKRGGALLTQKQIDESYYGKATLWRARWTILKLYRSAKPSRFLAFQNQLEQLAEQVDIECLWGAKDKYIPTHMADMMHAKSKQVLPECGHWVPLEAPSQLAELINEGVCDEALKAAV